MKFLIYFCYLLIFVKAQENQSAEQITTTATIKDVVKEAETTSSDNFLPTPTLNSNVVNDLVPSLKKNILDAKSTEANEIEGKDFSLIQ